ncbi:MAG: HAD-IA family hydrolase [Candidatus Micrarchaeota archaeon]
MLKAVLFDLDDTLLDGEGAFSRALTHSLKKFGLKSEVKTFSRGLGIDSTVNAVLPSLSEEEKREFSVYFASRYYSFYLPALGKLYPRVKEELLELKKKFKLGLVSNNSRNSLNKLLKNFGLNVFDVVVSVDDVDRIKPDPEGVNYALTELGVSSDEAVFVGDSEVDLQAAKAAGVKFFLVNRSFNKGLRAKKISSLLELLKLK